MPGLKLMGEVGLDGSGFEAGIKRLEGMAHGFAEGLKGFVVQAIGVLTVEQAISKTVETAKELINTSKRLAIAPEQLQLMRQGAKDAGVELEDVAKFIEKIDVAREKALRRQGVEPMEMRRNFQALGVSPEMLHTMSGAQLLMGPLARTAQNRSPEEIGALFKSLGGLKDFGQMIPFLKTNFEELGKKMHAYGAIMDTEAMVALKSFEDEVDLVSTTIVSHLAPALVTATEWIYKFAAAAASAVSFLGGATYKVSLKDILKLAIPAYGAYNFFQKLDFSAGKQSFGDTFKPWMDQLDTIKKKIAEDADKLRHPKPPTFETSSLPEKISLKALESHADSMTKVGNFLGGMGIAGQIEQKKVQLLTRVADGIDKIVAKTGGAFWFHGETVTPVVPGPFQMLQGSNFPH